MVALHQSPGWGTARLRNLAKPSSNRLDRPNCHGGHSTSGYRTSACVTCYWVGSDSGDPVMCTMSYPQQPCPGDSCLWLLLWGRSLSYLVFLFPFCLLFSSELLSFPKNTTLSCWAWRRTASVLPCVPPAMFLAWFALGPTCLSSWLSRVSVESSSNTVFWVNAVSLSAFFTVRHPHPIIGPGNGRV